MKKSVILSVTAAAALLAANPTTSSASTGAEQNSNIDVKTQSYQFSNMEDFQSFVKQIEDQYNISIQDSINFSNKKVEQEPAPKESAPAPSKAQAPSESPTNEAAEPAQNNETKQENGLSQFEQEVVNLTNAEREKAGLPALKVDTELSKVAEAKSEDMKANNYFAHNSPTYGSPFEMMDQFGVEYRTAGENIAKGQQTPEAVVNAWMNSEGHRKNIMNESFTHIGVGHVEEGNIWTQQFIGK
ncbi:CAP domain-containing protein [Guptibacillus algicola]|uniref:CAP domain-containing protein n=1 Tax=Guptibacillus algicola TaxID=225844 RepID=UPI001CD5FC43|nr:CAP domain-containing protein [Alkalihalobacillus algicola]MCA0987666.1 CAP domain-containing protein [Alkalihalobacillus algicola]